MVEDTNVGRKEAAVNSGTPHMAAWLESAWLARYLDRQLDAGETAWFEAYLLDKPDLLAAVEIDNAMRDTIATDPVAMRSRRASDVPDMENTEARAPSIGDTPRGAQRWMRWAGTAAVLALGVGIGSLARHSPWPARGDGGVIANPERVVFDTMRGEQAPPLVQHGAGRSRYVFVEVAVPATASSVQLRRGQRDEALVVSPEGFVSFLFDTQDADPKTPLVIEYAVDGQRHTQTIAVDQFTGEKS